MWDMSTLAQEVIRGSHSMTVRATAFGSTIGMASDLPVSGGSISMDTTSAVRRSGTIDIANPLLWPEDPEAMLSPIGSELFVEYGIVLPGRAEPEWIPVIRGPVTKAGRSKPAGSSAAVKLTLADRSQKIAEDRYATATQVGGGASTYVGVITDLIQRTLPDAVIHDLTGDATPCPTFEIQQNPWTDGIEKLADAIAAEVFCNPVGEFVIRPQPQLTDPSVWLVDSGQKGVLIGADEEIDRESVYNGVTASGQRSDGIPPVSATVVDDDPTSPTYWDGPFGHKPRFYVSPLLTDVDQCAATAAALLARAKGRQKAITLTALCNPALDGGDVFLTKDGAEVAAQILDSGTIPLSPKDAQSLVCRTLKLPDETGN